MIEPETVIRKMMPEHCRFYGADADSNSGYNKQLFTSINGSYFDGGIAAVSGKQEAFVLTSEFFSPSLRKGFRFCQ